MLSLNIKDPRELLEKMTNTPTELLSTEARSDAQETNDIELASLGGKLDKNKALSSLSWSELVDSQSNVDDLWYSSTTGLRPPVEDSVLSKEKHCERMVNFCLDDIESGEANSSTKMGLPSFPSDFPDCKAYSCFMAAKDAAFNKNEELRPPSVRLFKVPILPPWGIVCVTFNKEISAVDTLDLSTREDLTNANSLSNSCSGSSKILNFICEDNSFDGTVARTGYMLTTFINESKAGQLLLFPHVAEGNDTISKFIQGEQKLDLMHKSSVIYDHKLCFLRVMLHPFKEGFFEEGAVICAPCLSDISLWTSSSVKSEKELQLSQSAMRLYFKEHSSGKWEIQIPDDSIARVSHRCPIGFVTSASVQGNKRLAAEGFCEAVLLSHLREEQWKEMPVKQRREIYVLVRNLRSVAYRLALASVVLEYQENDVEFF